ncbi:hypothetical protein [Glycomyces algeriensis]|uniref:Uncharacterized protein n=1 Tax=Glycomyces algeriensis TaxID=256037 RepID=A0A9W6LHI8_9ACTN|nr:hypothetical protein [Glycomyces algeriensis]MDA1364799.1 hypothetical protein [Glycomyces algeriensis]MDR7350142.1 hypothetical protein [Glycomyces algeriensis]GLI42854.1 hypothetical protein GALLR39Z86_27040 [Glycomyces algeriensis]
MKRRKHRRTRTLKRFIVVGRTPPGAWPVEVGIHPAGRDSVLSFSEGPHQINAGGLVHVANVLDESRTGVHPLFARQFDATGLHWLVPLLVRLHGGEDVEGEITAAYRERHGGPPERRD